MRMRMAVCRMRMRVTVLRIRMRLSARVWPSAAKSSGRTAWQRTRPVSYTHLFGQDETIGGEKWGEGDTLNYLEADEEGHKQYLPVCFETLNRCV